MVLTSGNTRFDFSKLVALRLTGDAQRPPEQLAGPARPATERDLHAETEQLVADRLAAGRSITGTDLARQLGTSARHGRRLLAAHRGAVDATSNGQPHGQANERG